MKYLALPERANPDLGLRPRDRPTRRDNTLGSWYQQHTPSMINPDYNMMPAISVRTNQYSAYQKQIKAWIESNRRRSCHVTT